MNLTVSEGFGGVCHTDSVRSTDTRTVHISGPSKAEVEAAMEDRNCGWCGDPVEGVNHQLCVEPLQTLAESLDDRAAGVEERADVARDAATRILRVA